MDLALCASFARATNLSPTVEPRCFRDIGDAGVDLREAQRCLQLEDESYQGCGLLRLDSDARQSAEGSCASVLAPALLPPKGRCQSATIPAPCEHPAGTYSFCYYVSEGGQGTCESPRPLLAAHQRCELQGVCSAGLRCRSVDRNQKTCELLAQDGAYCQLDADCGSGTCAIDPNDRGGNRCATEPASLIEAHCEDARAIAQDALYPLAMNEHADNVWLRDDQVFWLEGTKLFSAPRDGSAAPRLRNQLPSRSYVNYGFVDGERLWVSTSGRELWQLPLDASAPSQPELDLSYAAVAFDDAALWVADNGCKNVERIAAGAVTRWSVPAEPTLEQLANWTPSLLAHDGSVYCAFADYVWRLSMDGSKVQLASPGPYISWIGAGKDELIAYVADGSDHALFSWSIAPQTWTRWTQPSSQEVDTLSGGKVDPATSRLYASDGLSLIALARGDTSLRRIAIANAQLISRPDVADGWMYWQGSGLLWRHPAL